MNLDVPIFQHMAQSMLLTHCGMVKDAMLVTVAVHRLAYHGYNRGVLGKFNELIKARICRDQTYTDEGILIYNENFNTMHI